MLRILKKIWVVLLVGLIVRLVLMPVTFHPDLWAISFSQYFFAYKGIINIYDFLASLPASSVLVANYGQNFFTYPPLAYFTLGFFGFLLRPLFNADFFGNLAGRLPNVYSDSRLYWHLFLTKLPYLFFDFGILVLLTDFFEDKKKKVAVALLWSFNPLVLYTSFMIGQFDIIPVFFVILSLFLVKKNHLFWAAFSLGVGGAYKMFPLFFLPFLVISAGKNFKDKLKYFFIGLFPYFVSILPFISSPVFRQTVLFSDQSQKMLFAKIPVSAAEYLSIFVVLYIFLLGISICRKFELWKWFLSVMMMFFSVTHYHPQWFLWLTPFLIIFWIEYPDYKIFPITLLACWFLIMLFFEPSLSIGLFAPLSSSLSQTVPLSISFSKFYDVFQFKSVVRSIFAGVSIASLVLLFKRDEIV